MIVIILRIMISLREKTILLALVFFGFFLRDIAFEIGSFASLQYFEIQSIPFIFLSRKQVLLKPNPKFLQERKGRDQSEIKALKGARVSKLRQKVFRFASLIITFALSLSLLLSVSRFVAFSLFLALFLCLFVFRGGKEPSYKNEISSPREGRKGNIGTTESRAERGEQEREVRRKSNFGAKPRQSLKRSSQGYGSRRIRITTEGRQERKRSKQMCDDCTSININSSSLLEIIWVEKVAS